MMLTEEDVGLVLRCVHEQAGLVFAPEKHYLVENRVEKLALMRGMETRPLLQALRDGNIELRAQVAEAMAIQETYFFRDPWFFESLRTDVLPSLIRRRRAERSLQIWSAACSTGQEVWSVAMLLAQMPELAGWDIQIVGSDFSPAALEKARSGCYSHMEVNRGLPARELATHFRRQGLGWEVGTELRRNVRFCAINLIDVWPQLPRFDIVLLRNVLIYFDAAARREVLQRARGVMRQDGFLFLGGGESPQGVVDSFLPGLSGRSCYYRLREDA
ncbi:MAG: CheR family methyltransferase [Moraxellaceae bacterium]